MTEGAQAEVALPPRQVAELTDAQLVDVRTDAEWEAGRAPGARHAPLDELGRAVGELEADRPVVFYCRVGERSAMAADAFRASGWDAYTMDGGLLAWAEQGLPLDPEGGEVAAHHSLPDF